MPNYRQSDVSGQRYRRCVRIDLQNTLGATPHAIFFEEDVAILGDDTIIRPAGHIDIAMTAPNTQFPLLNPADDSVIGTGTHGQAYVLMYSLYRALADARDNPPPPPPPPEEPPE